MTIETLTAFFMWCTIINGALLVCWTGACLLIPDLVYRTQTRWFPMSRETWMVVFYSFLGGFKILFLVFNLVPYLVLRFMG